MSTAYKVILMVLVVLTLTYTITLGVWLEDQHMRQARVMSMYHADLVRECGQ